MNYENILKLNAEANKASKPSTSKSISFSQYAIWAQCPFKWKLRYVDKISIQKPSIILVFGTSMHETVQYYIRTMFTDSIKKADQLNLTGFLAEQMTSNYANQWIDHNNVHFSSKEEMNEYLVDGSLTLEYLVKHRKKYFTTKGYALVGIEIPICYPASEVNPNVFFEGYIDLVIYDKDLDIFIVYDFKTSTRGWKDKDKKDTLKRQQLILYKIFLSKILNVDPDKIQVVFMILKRKVSEAGDYPIPRIQQIKPSDGPNIRKATQRDIDNFISSCFNIDGSRNATNVYPAIKGVDSEHCKYCEFKDQHDICPPEQRKTAILKK